MTKTISVRLLPIGRTLTIGVHARTGKRLGVTYNNGDGDLPKDAVQAATLYKKACDGSDGRGCTYLGEYYEDGDGGLAKDSNQAFALYKKACDGGEMLGCFRLGSLYENSDDAVPTN